MKIVLKRDWLGHKSGKEVTVNEPTGLALIDRGGAEIVVETPPSGYISCTRCGAFVKLVKAKKGKVKSDEAGTEAEESKAA